MSKLSGLNNGFSSDSDSSEGSGWQQQKRDRRRRPYGGSGARVFYNHQRGSKNFADNGDLSESAESDKDSDYASPDRRNGTNARGRGLSGANRGLNSARRPFVKKFTGRGRAYVTDYDQERNVGSRYSDRDRYSDERKTGNRERSTTASRDGKPAVKKQDDDADERPTAASDSMRYSRNRRIVNQTAPAKPAEEIPKPKLPPVHHRNLPPRLQRKFGLINDSQDKSKAASTEVASAAAQNSVEQPQTVTQQQQQQQPEVTATSSTVPSNQTHNNVAEEKGTKNENDNNGVDANDEAAMFWRARQDFSRVAQPMSEQDEKKILTVAKEESRKEFERKKQLQLQRQKEMDQIKQICLQGFPALTPDIRNDIFRAVQSQIDSRVKAPLENSKPVEETSYQPSNNAPVGTKPPVQPITAPSEVFNQLHRFGRSPHICVSVNDSGETADKTNAEAVNVKLQVYPPPGEDVFHSEHSTSFFTVQNTNGVEMQCEQGTCVPFGPSQQKVEISPSAEISSFGIRNLFIGQPTGRDFMMQTGSTMSASNPNISQFHGDDVFDVFRPDSSVLPYASQPKSEPASKLTQSPIKPPQVASSFGTSRSDGMPSDFADPYSKANMFNDTQIREMGMTFTGGGVQPALRRTSNPDCIPDGVRAFTDLSPSRWGMSQPKPEITVGGALGQQDSEPGMGRLRGMNPHPDRRDQTEWIMSLFKANFGNPADRSIERKMNDIQPVTTFSDDATQTMHAAENNNSAGSSDGILEQNSPPHSTSHENNVTVTNHKRTDLDLERKSASPTPTGGMAGKNETIVDKLPESKDVKANTADPGSKLVLAVDALPFVPQNLAVSGVAADEKDNENTDSATVVEANPKSPKLEAVAEDSVTLSLTSIPESGNFMEGIPSIPHMNMMPQFMPGYPTPWPMSMPMTPMGPMPGMPYYPQWPYYPPMPMMMPMPMMPMPYWQTPRTWSRMPPGMVHPMMQQQVLKQASVPVSVPAAAVPQAVAADGEPGIQSEETKQ